MGPVFTELAHRLLLPVLYSAVCAQIAVYNLWQSFLEALSNISGFFFGLLLISRRDNRVRCRKRIRRDLRAHSVALVVHDLDVTSDGLDDLTYLLLWSVQLLHLLLDALLDVQACGA